MSGRGARIWAVAGVAGAVLLAAAVLSFGLSHRDALASTPLVKRAAPAFTLPSLDARQKRPVRLSDFRGQVVVVNFWASWCTECHTEQAALNQTWDSFRDSGVVVLGVDFEDAGGDARQYVATSGVSYPVVVDRDSSTALAYGVRGVPETYVVDPRGRIVEREIGPVSATRLRSTLDGLLAGTGR